MLIVMTLVRLDQAKSELFSEEVEDVGATQARIPLASPVLVGSVESGVRRIESTKIWDTKRMVAVVIEFGTLVKEVLALVQLDPREAVITVKVDEDHSLVVKVQSF